jgi:hypothetical protein
VDGRDKPGHDEGAFVCCSETGSLRYRLLPL